MVAGATAGEVVFGWLVGFSGIQAEVLELGGEVFHADGVGDGAGGGHDEAVCARAQQRAVRHLMSPDAQAKTPERASLDDLDPSNVASAVPLAASQLVSSGRASLRAHPNQEGSGAWL